MPFPISKRQSVTSCPSPTPARPDETVLLLLHSEHRYLLGRAPFHRRSSWRGLETLIPRPAALYGVTDIRYIWTFELQLLGSNSWTVEDLEALMGYIRDGRMEPVIDTVLPLENAAEGIRMIEDREVFGKIIIEP